MSKSGGSAKLRAQNCKKNNFNQKKVERHLAYIENILSEYNKALTESNEDQKEVIEKEIQKQKSRKKHYRGLEKKFRDQIKCKYLFPIMRVVE